MPILGANGRQGKDLGITDLADGITRRVEALGDTLSGAFMEPVIRLGVTGLARSGKTVFITSLVANLIDRARMGARGGSRPPICNRSPTTRCRALTMKCIWRR